MFFAYWVSLGRHADFRERINAALDRYREVFLPVCEQVVAERGLATTGAALSTVVVALVQGTAVQAARDDGKVDLAGFLATVRTLIEDVHPLAPVS